MIPKGLFTQIAMIILSFAIIFTYVKPMFEEIASTQDDIGVYQAERSKVMSVNSQLASLVDTLEGVTNIDQRRLITYLPDSVDTVSVQRDIKLITQEAGVIYKEVLYDDASQPKSSRQRQSAVAGMSDENMPEVYMFSLTVEGRYAEIKNLFALLEQNNYPLEVYEANISQTEGGLLMADITLVTYAYKSSFTGTN